MNNIEISRRSLRNLNLILCFDKCACVSHPHYIQDIIYPTSRTSTFTIYPFDIKYPQVDSALSKVKYFISPNYVITPRYHIKIHYESNHLVTVAFKILNIIVFLSNFHADLSSTFPLLLPVLPRSLDLGDLVDHVLS